MYNYDNMDRVEGQYIISLEKESSTSIMETCMALTCSVRLGRVGALDLAVTYTKGNP